MQKSVFSTKRLVTDAILAAMFFVLNLYSIQLRGFKFTLDSLPCILASLLFGPVDGFLVAFLGTFAQQMMQYGFTATTLLWMLAPALRGLILGLLAKTLQKPLTSSGYVLYFIYNAVASIFVTAGNTAVHYLDSKLFGYYSFALVFGSAVVRFVTGIVISVLMALVALPIIRALRKSKLI